MKRSPADCSSFTPSRSSTILRSKLTRTSLTASRAGAAHTVRRLGATELIVGPPIVPADQEAAATRLATVTDPPVQPPGRAASRAMSINKHHAGCDGQGGRPPTRRYVRAHVDSQAGPAARRNGNLAAAFSRPAPCPQDSESTASSEWCTEPGVRPRQAELG